MLRIKYTVKDKIWEGLGFDFQRAKYDQYGQYCYKLSIVIRKSWPHRASLINFI